MMLGKSKSDKIVTTLDAGLQRRLEELAQNWKGRLPPRSSLAMIVVDHTDMRVRGWVGSVDLNNDSRFGHVDMVNAIRSPGSVLKPFAYGLALDEGLKSIRHRCCKTSPGAPVIIDQVTLIAVFMARSA